MFCSRVTENQDTWLVWHLEGHVIIDYQLAMINKSDQSFFLKIQEKENDLYYKITSLLPIYLYFRTSCMDFESIKRVFDSFIESVAACEVYLLTPMQLYLDASYIYYDGQSGQIHLMYLPFHLEESCHMHSKTKNIFLSLLYQHPKFDVLYEDNRIRNLVDFLQGEHFDLYTLKSFLDMQKKEKNRNRINWITKMFQKNQKKVLVNEKNTILEETIMMPYVASPILEFEKSRVEINKSHFSIGRSQALNDYSLPEALTLGRIHAEIISEAGAFYLMDMDTKNGTFINGKKLESQSKYPLQSGDKIKFANEEAVFK